MTGSNGENSPTSTGAIKKGTAETLRRIIEATVDALAWSGADRFSMIEVAHAAKVSRQTLYRYFPSKDDLLEGVMSYLQEIVSSRLSERILQDPSLEGRLHTISAYDIDERDGRPGITLLQAEPAFMLRFLNAHATDICPILERALEPFFDQAEANSNIKIDRKTFVEAIMRIRMSIFVVPGNTQPDFAIRTIRAMVRGLLSDPQQWSSNA